MGQSMDAAIKMVLLMLFIVMPIVNCVAIQQNTRMLSLLTNMIGIPLLARVIHYFHTSHCIVVLFPMNTYSRRYAYFVYNHLSGGWYLGKEGANCTDTCMLESLECLASKCHQMDSDIKYRKLCWCHPPGKWNIGENCKYHTFLIKHNL